MATTTTTFAVKGLSTALREAESTEAEFESALNLCLGELITAT